MADVSNVRMISDMYKASELDTLKDAASLPSIGLRYIYIYSFIDTQRSLDRLMSHTYT